MTAKPSKRSSSNKKNDTKAALIVGCIVLAVITIFLFYNSDQKPAHKPVPVKKAQPKVATVPPRKFLIEDSPVVTQPVKKTVVPAPAPVLNKRPRGSAGKIAFVLDDWGYTTRNCKYLKEIKAPLATAILPNLRHTEEVIKCSTAAGKVVMLHLPMEPFHNVDHYPDNYLISSKMKPALVEKIIEDTLKKMPTVVGVNNHMGSKALESAPLMRLVLRILKKHNLFFMDSMTSPNHSVGAEVAAEVGISFAQRDVFLDNVNTKDAITKQFTELVEKAERKGFAIAIGHDRDLTLRVIKEQIPFLENQGFEIVAVTELLKTK